MQRHVQPVVDGAKPFLGHPRASVAHGSSALIIPKETIVVVPYWRWHGGGKPAAAVPVAVAKRGEAAYSGMDVLLRPHHYLSQLHLSP